MISAGLTTGTLKFVNVTGNPAEIINATTRATNITNGTRFTLSGTASTTFSRPEDGAWSSDGSKYYFVTTDRLDNTELTGSTQKGATRLWRLTFDNIANPDLGGKIDLLVDGSSYADGAGKPNMFDNMNYNANGTITVQEDTGNAAHNGKMWKYDTATSSLTLLAHSDTARFGDVVGGVFVAGANQQTQDEETSGVIDVTDVIGDGMHHELFVMQNHKAAVAPDANGLVEGGQLLITTAAGFTNITADISVYSSGLVYNRSTQRYTGTLQLTNNGSSAITGPLQVQLVGLPTGVTLSNASGIYAGSPYISSNAASLAPGQTMSVALSFSNPSKVALSYSTTIYSGNF
jgi:hypothetical protein